MKTHFLSIVIATALATTHAATSGASSSLGIDCALLVDECPPEQSPVCASNGQTYGSRCEFAQAHCATPEAELTIVQEGPCEGAGAGAEAEASPAPRSTTDEPKPVVDDPKIVPIQDTKLDAEFAPPASAGDERGTYINLKPYCQLDCTAYGVNPVCGSDHNSYINPCHLLSTKCHSPTLEKLYGGLCVVEASNREGRGSGEQPFDVLEASAPYIPKHRVIQQSRGHTTTAPSSGTPQCNAHCPRSYDPLCGSDGVTYANECLLAYAMCTNPSVKKVHDGKCHKTEPSTNDNNGHVVMPLDEETPVGCVPSPCSSVEAPVCGSNGETYMNRCLFQNDQCHHPQLTILHEGDCGAHSGLSCQNMFCPPFSECKEHRDTGTAYCADLCSPERCNEFEDCELHESNCFTAPCSPVATCVPRKSYAVQR